MTKAEIAAALYEATSKADGWSVSKWDKGVPGVPVGLSANVYLGNVQVR